MPFKLSVLLGFRPEVASLNRTAEQIRNTLNRSKITGFLPITFKKDLDTFNRDLKNVQREIGLTSNRMERLGALAALSLRRFSAFSLATGSIFGFTRATTSAVKDAVEFQRQLVRIAQIGTDTAAGLKLITDNITRLSKSFGVNAGELANLSVIIAQTGRSARDTRQILNAVAEASLAPTFGSMESTTEGLIAALTQFNIEASKSKDVLGSINEVASKFPVEANDIVAAIRRAGSTFAAASNPLDSGTEKLNKFIATFSAIRGTTRESAETIATGLRTIVTRFQRVSTINKLQQFGVEGLLDNEGKFVGAFEAINQLSRALGNLAKQGPSPELSGILEELGGFRQINKTIPLITGLNKRLDAYQVAQNANNSITEDAEKAQEALQVQLNKTREEFGALIRELVLSKGFQSFAKNVLDLTNNFIKLVNALEPAIPLILTLASAKLFTGGLSFLRGFRTEGKNPGLLTGGRQAGTFLPFATGGRVPGSGNTDSVPSMLMPGEVVINKKAVQRYGAGNLLALNRAAGGSNEPLVKDGIQYFVRGGISGGNAKIRRDLITQAGATPEQKVQIEKAVNARFKELSREVGPSVANKILAGELKNAGSGVSGLLSSFAPKRSLATLPPKLSTSRAFTLVREPQKLLTGPRNQSPLLLTDQRKPPVPPVPINLSNAPNQAIDPTTLAPIPPTQVNRGGIGLANPDTLAPEAPDILNKADRAAQARIQQQQAISAKEAKTARFKAARAAGLSPLQIAQREKDIAAGRPVTGFLPPTSLPSTSPFDNESGFRVVNGEAVSTSQLRKNFQKEESRRRFREGLSNFGGAVGNRVNRFRENLNAGPVGKLNSIGNKINPLSGLIGLTAAGIAESSLRKDVSTPGGSAALGGLTGGLSGFGIGAQFGPGAAIVGGLFSGLKGALDGFQNEIEKVNTDKLVKSFEDLDKAISQGGLSGARKESDRALEASNEQIRGVARRGSRFGSTGAVFAGLGGLGSGASLGRAKFGIAERTFLSQEIGALERVKLDAQSVFNSDSVARREIEARNLITKRFAGDIRQSALEQSESILIQREKDIQSGRKTGPLSKAQFSLVARGSGGDEAEALRRLRATAESDVKSGNREQIKTGLKFLELISRREVELGQKIVSVQDAKVISDQKLIDAALKSKIEVDELAERLRNFAARVQEAANAGDALTNKIGNIQSGTFNPLDRTNVFNNPRAFSSDKIRNEILTLQSAFGPLGEIGRVSLGGKDIATGLRKRFVDIAKNPPNDEGQQQQQLLDVVNQEFGDLPPAIKNSLEQEIQKIFTARQTQTGSLLQFVETVDFQELAGKFTDIANSGLSQLTTNLNQINRDYAAGLKNNLDQQIALNNKKLDLDQQAASFAIDRNKLFGRETSVAAQTNPIFNRVKSLTGGISNVNGIVDNLSFFNNRKNELSNAFDNTSDQAERQRLIEALSNNEKAIKDNEQALHILAEDTTQLAAIEDKIKSIQEKEQSRRSLIERLATAGPEEILQINREIQAALAGLTNGFAGLSGQQRGAALNILGQLAPAALSPEQAAEFQDKVLQSITGGVFPKLIKGFSAGVNNNLFDLTGSKKLESALINAQQTVIDANNALISLEQGKIDEVKQLVVERANVQLNTNREAVQQRNSGGLIPGRGPNRDTVPAMLTKGEFVVNRDAADANMDLLMAINNGYALGGTVSPLPLAERKEIRRNKAAAEYAARKRRLSGRGISVISPASQQRRELAEKVRNRTAIRRANIRRLLRVETDKNRNNNERGTINGKPTGEVLAASDLRAAALKGKAIINGKAYDDSFLAEQRAKEDFLRRTKTGIINGKVYTPGSADSRYTPDNAFTKNQTPSVPGGLINGKPTKEVLGPKRRYNTGGRVGGSANRGGGGRSFGEFSSATEKLTKSIDPFIQAINQFGSVLSNLGNIPSKIEMTGRHEVNVNINGAEVLASMKEPLKGLVMQEINKNISRYINPVDGSTNESVLPVSNGRRL